MISAIFFLLFLIIIFIDGFQGILYLSVLIVWILLDLNYYEEVQEYKRNKLFLTILKYIVFIFIYSGVICHLH